MEDLTWCQCSRKNDILFSLSSLSAHTAHLCDTIPLTHSKYLPTSSVCLCWTRDDQLSSSVNSSTEMIWSLLYKSLWSNSFLPETLSKSNKLILMPLLVLAANILDLLENHCCLISCCHKAYWEFQFIFRGKTMLKGILL